MESNQLQQQIFSTIREKLPTHLSLADELQELLGLSADSIYRRIRGEKPISLPELKTICEHFHLSLDEMLNLTNDSVLFHAPGLTRKSPDFKEYLLAMREQFRYFNSFPEKKMHYLCKDLPFWYFYLFPEVAAFKTFLWMKTIHNYPSMKNQVFAMDEFPSEEYFKIGQEIIQLYNLMPSEELWNNESINSTLNQISYYREAGIFATKEDEKKVIDSFSDMMGHLEDQCAAGRKFMPGDSELTYRSSIQFYVNELILGNNTILLNLGGKRLSLITHSVLSYLMTTDERFAELAFSSYNSLVGRSALISVSGEKERHRFFNNIQAKIKQLRDH
ncbi:MAG: helix-turn-helix transcriptional regulator [Chitinophagaceae bacterium]|nr:helix-turn-helix transcriptional regulator [Chitinophagaceae bacterium]